jgi:streptomycin 3"-adenylyltransferase
LKWKALNRKQGEMIMFNTGQILNDIVYNYKNILKSNLTGIYLHGSLAMNCYNPNSSDIDFLVVVKKDISPLDKRELVNILLKLSDNCSEKGFEMSVILEEDILNFKYPTPFMLHYSNFYKDKYISEPEFICDNSADYDLAAHFVVTRERGICLFGKPINEVFMPVKEEYYIDSIVRDIGPAREDIIDNPVYMVLNLCRVLYYLSDRAICSKKEGGEWGKAILPSQYKNIIESALLTYTDSSCNCTFSERELMHFADFMLRKIENKQKEIKMSSNYKDDIRAAYNKYAGEREKHEFQQWKAAPRDLFLQYLEKENKKSLLEIGAGHGRDSKFFMEKGFDVTAVDISREMVKLCREKSINAYEMDFYSLHTLGKTYDAVWAMNCLLHVEKVNLPAVLIEINKILNPSGLFFMGVYGGEDSEGVWEEDFYTPKRFFSSYSDENIKNIVSDYFELVEFENIETGGNRHFQSIILRKK